MKTKDEIFSELYARYPALAPCAAGIEAAFGLLLECAETNGLIMVCGNGGSAADAEHIVGELMKGFLQARPLTRYQKESFDDIEGGREIADRLQRGVRAVSLVSQSGLISAFANDVDAGLVYAQQVFIYAASDTDVLLALSTSGNSENVVNAAKAAKAAGIRTVAVTGQTGGRLSRFAAVTVKLPAIEPYAVQEFPLPVYHALCAALEAEIFQ
jgi:phosphoheptose isomerase